jgi:hypothetical protein
MGKQRLEKTVERVESAEKRDGKQRLEKTVERGESAVTNLLKLCLQLEQLLPVIAQRHDEGLEEHLRLVLSIGGAQLLESNVKGQGKNSDELSRWDKKPSLSQRTTGTNSGGEIGIIVGGQQGQTATQRTARTAQAQHKHSTAQAQHKHSKSQHKHNTSTAQAHHS